MVKPINTNEAYRQWNDNQSIERASFVEPDDVGIWWADMWPMLGPKLGPFETRAAALAAEREWLEAVL
jgi:hypothetical protein